MTPVLYLDVDGVLNGFDHAAMKHHWPDTTTYAERPGSFERYYELNLSQAMGLALCALDCDIRWATTWGDSANRCVSPHIGLPTDLPVAAKPKLSPSNFKGVAIRREVEQEQRPFIWIDDEAIWPMWRHWAEAMADHGVPNLLVEPDPQTGLTPDDIMRVAEWIEGLS